MNQPSHLRLCLHPPLLQMARQGKLGIAVRLAEALHPLGWSVEICAVAQAGSADLPGYALVHMDRPPHGRALTLRLAYHYPFWQIERVAERWRWPVARARFDPVALDPEAAADFASRLRRRVLPGPAPTTEGPVLIALQGKLQRQRSFQTASPLKMVETVARTGRPCVATLHPRETYSARDLQALDALARRFANLRIGGDSAAILRTCPFVATQNSALAFDGYILGKPAVLFAQSDFHHIALNVADLGAGPALAAAPGHRPDFARYLDWFLRRHALDMSAPDAGARLIAALRRGGWPL